ncbi:histidine ammonia-lyase [Luteitalea sp. TBR-22]|uniref:HAL/PAL/TAL family ammonia-lyase n=1 Tax=Luteitalea sp. TBR-22 TaxID=2802971 RepID=UPI001AF97381|nr:histidine ammonia-lyase [Luteitalea sp. TBR-22]BCS33955.1 histidine ammonia-lyase [Luteitalea sp. TBR-22]
MTDVLLDGSPLTPAQVEAVAHGRAAVTLAPAARTRLVASRVALERLLDDGEAHYGVNTGFGSLARTRIATDRLRDLQRNLVRSHAAGTGDRLPTPTVRATMLLLAASLARGASGVRPELVEQLLGCLAHRITPIVPSIGSVGASGDLAPLAAIARVVIGEGEVEGGPAAEALARAGLAPLVLEAKEGLALINGTHLMAAEAALLLEEWDALWPAAVGACAMAIDAVRATDAFLDRRVHALRGQPGQEAVAAHLRDWLRGTEIVESHRLDDSRVQDPYSYRCAPVVLGAALDAIAYVRAAVERELGAVTDNPLLVGLDADGGAPSLVSAGNFHGMPIALPLDVLTMALTHVAGIAQQRVFFLLSARDPESGLPPYLSPAPGLNSGLMVAQYTAAACCNELAGLSMPASVINVPTSAGIEDYNSFGPRAAAKARRAMQLTRTVVAIELLCAAQGIEGHRPLRSGDRVEAALARIRAVVPPLVADRPLTADIEAIVGLIEDGAFAAHR